MGLFTKTVRVNLDELRSAKQGEPVLRGCHGALLPDSKSFRQDLHRAVSKRDKGWDTGSRDDMPLPQLQLQLMEVNHKRYAELGPWDLGLLLKRQDVHVKTMQWNESGSYVAGTGISIAEAKKGSR